MDSQTMADVIKRLRRAQGQVGGVIRMIGKAATARHHRPFAAASRALDRAGFKIIATGLQQCAQQENGGGGAVSTDRAQLEKLFLSLA